MSLNLDENTFLSKIKGPKLEDIFRDIDLYLLQYRDTLNLPSDVSFGVEIEYEQISKHFVDWFMSKNFKDFNSWTSKYDGSLITGGEITSPIMYDEKEYWDELKKICDYLKKQRADTRHNAGGHIHVGTNAIGDDVDAWRCFLKTYMLFENVLFRFFYGDKVSARKNLGKFAKPVSDLLFNQLEKFSETKDIIDIKIMLCGWDKFRAVNFQRTRVKNELEKDNTIEFRCPNATVDYVIWQNNINAITKMLISAKEHKIDEEFLDYKIANEYHGYNNFEYLYHQIDLKSALEFVDIIFDNNLDKVYFLKQYLKGFQDNSCLTRAFNAKKMVK